MKINPGHPVCGCGTNVEAFEAALRLARQAFKVDEHGEVCPKWAMQVAESFNYIVYQFGLARTFRRIEENPEDYVGVSRRDVMHSAQHFHTEAAKYAVAATVHNDRLNKDLAKFVCEEINGGDAERDTIEKGPPESVLRDMGFEPEIVRVAVPDDLKVFFGLEDDGTSGSKPH